MRPEDQGKTVRMWRDTLAGDDNAARAQVTAQTIIVRAYAFSLSTLLGSFI